MGISFIVYNMQYFTILKTLTTIMDVLWLHYEDDNNKEYSS